MLVVLTTSAPPPLYTPPVQRASGASFTVWSVIQGESCTIWQLKFTGKILNLSGDHTAMTRYYTGWGDKHTLFLRQSSTGKSRLSATITPLGMIVYTTTWATGASSSTRSSGTCKFPWFSRDNWQWSTYKKGYTVDKTTRLLDCTWLLSRHRETPTSHHTASGHHLQDTRPEQVCFVKGIWANNHSTSRSGWNLA